MINQTNGHPILENQILYPPVRPERVSRLRLLGRLNASLNRKLTPISAPADFGKSTLLSEWVQTKGGATPPIAVAPGPLARATCPPWPAGQGACRKTAGTWLVTRQTPEPHYGK